VWEPRTRHSSTLAIVPGLIFDLDGTLARAGAFRVYGDAAELEASLDELGVLP
jgi:hypothetical protein